jgi:hypothetical protein
MQNNAEINYADEHAVSDLFNRSLKLYSEAFRGIVESGKLKDVCFAICMQNKLTGGNTKKLSIDKFVVTNECMNFLKAFNVDTSGMIYNNAKPLPVVQSFRIMCDSLTFLLLDANTKSDTTERIYKILSSYLSENHESRVSLAIDSDKEFIKTGVFAIPNCIVATDSDKDIVELHSTNDVMLSYIARRVLGVDDNVDEHDVNGVLTEEDYNKTELKKFFAFANAINAVETDMLGLVLPDCIPKADLVHFSGYTQKPCKKFDEAVEVSIIEGINEVLLGYAMSFNDSASVSFKFLRYADDNKRELLIYQSMKENLRSCSRLYNAVSSVFHVVTSGDADIEATKLLLKICKGR